jgi:hypothetical protein
VNFNLEDPAEVAAWESVYVPKEAIDYRGRALTIVEGGESALKRKGPGLAGAKTEEDRRRGTVAVAAAEVAAGGEGAGGVDGGGSGAPADAIGGGDGEAVEGRLLTGQRQPER